MDRQSLYTWTLTRDELNTIWDALTAQEDKWSNYAKKVRTGQITHFTEDECLAEARKYRELYHQINRMRRGY